MSVKLTILTVKRFTFYVMAFRDSYPYYNVNVIVKLCNYCKSNALFKEISDHLHVATVLARPLALLLPP